LEKLQNSRVKKVYIVGRRGVLQASFTVKELRELTNIPGVKFEVELAEDIPEAKTLPRIQQRIVQLLRKAPFNPDAEKLCKVEFLLSPRRFVGNDSGDVTVVEFEKQRLLDPLSPSSKIESTGDIVEIKANIVFTSIGYTSVVLKGMNNLGPGVDVIRGVIPNDSGGVIAVSTKDFGYVDKEAAMTERVPGVYVSGWLKTGPTGVIATTMYSAFETGDSLVQDWIEGREFLEPDSGVKGWEGFKLEIERVGGKPVEWEGWKRIEAEEIRRGRLTGKEREKIVDIQEMVRFVKK
jgi:adrenodoxin-NADP+ reductase